MHSDIINGYKKKIFVSKMSDYKHKRNKTLFRMFIGVVVLPYGYRVTTKLLVILN